MNIDGYLIIGTIRSISHWDVLGGLLKSRSIPINLNTHWFEVNDFLSCHDCQLQSISALTWRLTLWLWVLQRISLNVWLCLELNKLPSLSHYSACFRRYRTIVIRLFPAQRSVVTPHCNCAGLLSFIRSDLFVFPFSNSRTIQSVE